MNGLYGGKGSAETETSAVAGKSGGWKSGQRDSPEWRKCENVEKEDEGRGRRGKD